MMVSSDAAGENSYRITMTWSFRIFGSPQSQSGLAELRSTSYPRRFMGCRQNPWGRSAPVHSPNRRRGTPPLLPLNLERRLVDRPLLTHGGLFSYFNACN